MKPYRFDYVRAENLEAVYDALDQYGSEARILAGGQSLVPMLNYRLAQPGVLVDINPVAALSGITEEVGFVRIGALTRHCEVACSPVVARQLPLIAQAMPHIAHAAVRNRGTFGGSLCLADPAAELPACMVALGAEMILGRRSGERTVPAESFFLGLFETALEEGEVLLGARIPAAGSHSRAAIDEIARRHGDYAIVGVCAVADHVSEKFHNVQLVFFAVEDRPVKATRAAAALEGKTWTEAARSAALDAIAGDLAPNDDDQASATMRLHLARVLAGRVLASLAGDPEQDGSELRS
jgi:aerobic carbon-monoxide dehydrogenase medium subunit